ncbi:hypothetical protein [Corynebacterium mycetoides]|nr:hypothetical protein [Corynebacterium mycetoides]
MHQKIEIFHSANFLSLENQLTDSIKTASADGARWMDQKVTFDNLHTIANAVDLAVPNESTFTRFTIQDSRSFQAIVTREYGKPSSYEETAQNEYDKFILQPLCMLAFAGVLSSENRRTRQFTVRNRPLLRTIATSESEARTFLISYLETVLREWGWWNRISSYFESAQTEEDLRVLKRQFHYLMLEKTRVGSRGSKDPRVEINRIFTKVVNPLAYAYGARGTERGHVMKSIPSRHDLIYNRPNFSDARVQKPKNLTRRQFEEILDKKASQYPEENNLSRVMREVRSYHREVSEVPSTVGGKARHVHHIFPRSSFPKIADYRENLIVLTSAQHLFEAHPYGNTTEVDKIYQRNALLYKLESIKKSVDQNDGMYSYDSFARVVSLGYSLTVPEATYMGCKNAILGQLV